VKEQLALLPEYLTAHLRLSLLALGAGVLASLPLGVLAHRSPALERGLLGFASVVQTVPSLALLAIMVPALSALGQSGIGFLPAFIGLSLYSLLPMLRNTVTDEILAVYRIGETPPKVKTVEPTTPSGEAPIGSGNDAVKVMRPEDGAT